MTRKKPTPAPPPPASQSIVDVLVIGAGLSGLRAAVDLHRAGLTVTVLEARDRVGGKTLSLPASPLGGTVDVGAAWINDTSQSEMYALAREFGFDLVAQRAEGLNLYQMPEGVVKAVPHGSPPPFTREERERLAPWFEVLERRVQECDAERPHLSPHAKALDRMTFAEFALRECGSDVGVVVASIMTASLLGVEADEVSALFMVAYLKSGTGLDNLSSDLKDGGQFLRNRQGNQTFSIRLASLLPSDSVRLSSPVSRITQQSSGYCVVETTTGGTFRAKRVIVSIPSNFYPTIAFDPPLPTTKRTLADNTALGYYAKTVFVFERPWWREAGLSGLMESLEGGPITFTRDTCMPQDGQYSITCFIVGDSGRTWSKWSAAERRRQVTKQFDAVFGAAARKANVKVPSPVNVIEKEWVKDPWAGGAPSPVMMPGTLTDESGIAIREPFDRVHFIGTETSVVWKGYMEGAVRSGIRGAKEVIEALTNRK